MQSGKECRCFEFLSVQVNGGGRAVDGDKMAVADEGQLKISRLLEQWALSVSQLLARSRSVGSVVVWGNEFFLLSLSFSFLFRCFFY